MKLKPKITIRFERPGDEERIDVLTTEAFKTASHSNGDEALIIKRLRENHDLVISLVAVSGNEILGHVAFSPVTIDGVHNRWFGLAPVSVAPSRQRQGVGSLLIRRGLELLKERGAKGCALIGDPVYYSRFGFKSNGRLHYGDLETHFVQSLAFAGLQPQGELKFSRAFDVG